jgi:hypothetical protein
MTNNEISDQILRSNSPKIVFPKKEYEKNAKTPKIRNIGK